MRGQSFLGSGEEDFLSVITYLGMAAVLFNVAEPFEQIGHILSTEGPVWNLVKIGQVISEKIEAI